jgi:uncharacterized protein YqeY
VQHGPMTSTLRQQLSDALPEAMKAKERATVDAVRSALAAVANAEAVDTAGMTSRTGTYATEVERRQLTESQVEAIVREVHDELRAASDEMRSLGQQARATELADQADALQRFLDR